MKPPTRQEIFAQAAKKLRAGFDELKAVIPHAGAKGAEGEKLIREFLNAHMPQRFRASAGFVIDRKDAVSKQTDVVVYDALNCPVYRASDEAGIYPADNVAAVVEVKSTLDKQKLAEAAENIAAVKALSKTPEVDLPILSFAQTRGFVVAFESPLDLETLAQHYRESIGKHLLGRHIDGIVVLDRGLLTLAAEFPGGPGWGPMYWDGPGGPEAEGSHIAVGTVKAGEDSLDAFLRLFLPQLIFFRSLVDHPGFAWSGPEMKQMHLTYVGSITLEKDPDKKAKILAEYRQQVIDEFAKTKK